MMGTINCTYETPCGWCSKWDKKCDKKVPEREQNVTVAKPIGVNSEEIHLINKMCTSESDHDWECTGMSTAGTTFRCRKCFAAKTIPSNFKE